MSGRKRKFIPGVPCEHPGCLHHITHPCEGCGRIGGHWNNEEDDQSLPKEELELDSLDYLSYEPVKSLEKERRRAMICTLQDIFRDNNVHIHHGGKNKQ